MTDTTGCQTATPAGRDADLASRTASLAAALWAEREAVEDVVYKLTAQELVLQKAQRWLPRADNELALAGATMHDRTSERSYLAHEMANELGTPCTLAGLVVASCDPWPAVLTDHRLALRVLVRDVVQAALATRRQLRISARAVAESLAEVRVEARESPRQAAHHALGQLRTVERELLVTAADVSHRAALATVDELLAEGLAPLEEFLA